MANLFTTTKKAGRKASSLLPALFLLFGMAACGGSSWDKASTQKLTDECIRGSIAANDPMPQEFCDCIVPKVQARYKSIKEADSLMQRPIRIAEFAPECRVAPNEVPADWTEHSREMFLKSCEKLAREDGITDPGYCPCILQKVQRRYVTNTRMEAVNFERVRAIGKECLEGK